MECWPTGRAVALALEEADQPGLPSLKTPSGLGRRTQVPLSGSLRDGSTSLPRHLRTTGPGDPQPAVSMVTSSSPKRTTNGLSA